MKVKALQEEICHPKRRMQMKILVTGGTNGMGKGVAKVLAGADNQTHEVIILCRSKELGQSTAFEIENETSNKKTSIVLCDLAKLGDVRKAIRQIQEKHDFLDGIFINAGLGYAAKRIETEDGMDSHFQVNYLSQFMLTLNLLGLLENSKNGGRVVFNVTRGGKICWDDMQMRKTWSYEAGIHQAMAAKRMFAMSLHEYYAKSNRRKLSFVGFEIPKTVWTNQINIIPAPMRMIVSVMKLFGSFISIEKCGQIMAPLFTEPQEESLKKSGKFVTWKNGVFTEIAEGANVTDKDERDRLWKISLELCGDEKTAKMASSL